LVKNGADVNARDNFGLTPLMWADRKENSEIWEILIKHGAKE
jgi:ankyrin repeat protein